MRRAIQYISHTFRLIFGNIKEALHVSVGWFLLLGLLATLIFLGISMSSSPAAPNITPGSLFLAIAVLFVAGYFAASAAAVSWHRYILLDEKITGFLPIPPMNLIGRYLLRIIGISLLGLLVAVVVMLIFMLVFKPLLTGMMAGMGGKITYSTLILLMIPNLLVAAPVHYVLFRLFVSLPAVALGREDFSIGDGWSASAKESGPIAWIIVLMLLMNLLLSIVILLSTVSIEPLQVIPLPTWMLLLQIVFYWFYFMFSICILTTLYGVLVEGRELT